MEQRNPLVSIIVRTKDRPKLLKRALRSIASQTYRPIEVVLVNDGGCDLDGEELKSILGDVPLNYKKLDNNSGRAGAANAGVENAGGEFVGFLDDDDIYYPPAVEMLVEGARLHDNKVMYGRVVCKTYKDSEDIGCVDEGRGELLGAPFDAGRLVFENSIPINSLLVPRYLFGKAGPFDRDFEIYEDWDMLLRLSEVAEFSFVDAVVAEYSIHGTATITGRGGIALQSGYKEKILEKHIGKVRAKDFIVYVQSVVDRVVLEEDRRMQDRLRDEISGKDEELHKAWEGVTYLRGVVEEKDNELQTVKDELRKAWERIAPLEDALKAMSSRNEELSRLNEELLSSNSWKITKPLRVLGAALRRVSGKMRIW